MGQSQGLLGMRAATATIGVGARCRLATPVTAAVAPGADNPVHLIASHCKPWRDSTNEERLDGENGLLMTPSMDHLFDRGFIGFEDSGTLILSPVAHRPSLERMGIQTQRTINVGGFSEGQRRFLDYHRNLVLLRAVR
jgi:HNH endonuclease